MCDVKVDAHSQQDYSGVKRGERAAQRQSSALKLGRGNGVRTSWSHKPMKHKQTGRMSTRVLNKHFVLSIKSVLLALKKKVSLHIWSTRGCSSWATHSRTDWSRWWIQFKVNHFTTYRVWAATPPCQGWRRCAWGHSHHPLESWRAHSWCCRTGSTEMARQTAVIGMFANMNSGRIFALRL